MRLENANERREFISRASRSPRRLFTIEFIVLHFEGSAGHRLDAPPINSSKRSPSLRSRLPKLQSAIVGMNVKNTSHGHLNRQEEVARAASIRWQRPRRYPAETLRARSLVVDLFVESAYRNRRLGLRRGLIASMLCFLRVKMFLVHRSMHARPTSLARRPRARTRASARGRTALGLDFLSQIFFYVF